MDEQILGETTKKMYEGKLILQETITWLKEARKINLGIKDIKAVVGVADTKIEENLRVLTNAIACLENAYEDEGQEKDLSKDIFILQQKDKLKTSNLIDKLDEEVFEFKDALINGDRENQFEEILDIFQIAITIMAEVMKPTDVELMNAISAHNEKLLVDRQYKTKGTAIKFLFEE